MPGALPFDEPFAKVWTGSPGRAGVRSGLRDSVAGISGSTSKPAAASRRSNPSTVGLRVGVAERTAPNFRQQLVIEPMRRYSDRGIEKDAERVAWFTGAFVAVAVVAVPSALAYGPTRWLHDRVLHRRSRRTSRTSRQSRSTRRTRTCVIGAPTKRLTWRLATRAPTTRARSRRESATRASTSRLTAATTWTQPTYTGWTARTCVGFGRVRLHAGVGPIGTLPSTSRKGWCPTAIPAVDSGRDLAQTASAGRTARGRTTRT